METARPRPPSKRDARRDPRRIDGRRFSHATNEAVRILAVQEVMEGQRPSAVMRRYGLCRTSIYRWLRAARRGGTEALAARPHPGREPTLSAASARQVRGWILGKTPADHGLSGTLWTRTLLADLIRRETGVTLGRNAVARVLARIGLDPSAASERPGEEPGVAFGLDGRGSFLCRPLRTAGDRAPNGPAARWLRERSPGTPRLRYLPGPADPTGADGPAGNM